MRVQLALLALAVAYAAAGSPGFSDSGGKYQSRNGDGDATSNGGTARGRPVAFSSNTDKRGRKSLGVSGARDNSVKTANRGPSGAKNAKAFKTEDNGSMSGNAEGSVGALGLLDPKGDTNVNMRSTGRRGRNRAKATRNKASEDFGFDSRKTKAQLKTESQSKQQQTGTIILEGHRNNPFTYKVTCPPGSRAGAGDCDETLTGRDGTTFNCEATGGRGGATRCWRNRGRGVGASTDSDGNTETNFKGISFSKADCQRVGEERRCKISKGLLGASAKDIKATRSGVCYRPGKSAKSVDISNVRYTRDPGSGGSMEYNSKDCFTMEGDLNFRGYSRAELKGIMSRIGLQFHAMITPVGKLKCADEQVCPMKGKANECFYCNLCRGAGQGRKDQLLGTAALKEACEQDGSRRQRFSVRYCPPDVVKEGICPSFRKDLSSEYGSKKGDLDSRVEVYYEPGKVKSDAELKAAFARLNFIQKTILRTQAAAAKLSTNVDDLDLFETYKAQQYKGKLVGCSTFTAKYGLGNGGSSVGLEALVSGASIARGGGASFIRSKEQCDALRAEKKRLYGLD